MSLELVWDDVPKDLSADEAAALIDWNRARYTFPDKVAVIPGEGKPFTYCTAYDPKDGPRISAMVQRQSFNFNKEREATITLFLGR